MIVTRRNKSTLNGVIKPRGLPISHTLRTALDEAEVAATFSRVESTRFPPVWKHNTTSEALKTPKTSQWYHSRGKRGMAGHYSVSPTEDRPFGFGGRCRRCLDAAMAITWEAGSYVIGTSVSQPFAQNHHYWHRYDRKSPSELSPNATY